MSEEEAARWMLGEYEEFGFLYQEGAASHLFNFQDERLAYFDQNSNLCIGKSVLAVFNRLTPDAVYERAGKFWRRRLDTDQPGRQQ
ncbi:DUF6953 family protein [Hansschlegelia quercus]|uniref:Uncharacterized protein n=1 Tax=Hansschlegelia quercus TaxID=2528245 RepID=A0A4Q9GNG4_9HYPH|nr:hypothetical protein [Hansschlegelia quercus]TBN54715.1 hypothetical protein EYR15_00665 [Hansschlegelia quercus]